MTCTKSVSAGQRHRRTGLGVNGVAGSSPVARRREAPGRAPALLLLDRFPRHQVERSPRLAYATLIAKFIRPALGDETLAVPGQAGLTSVREALRRAPALPTSLPWPAVRRAPNADGPR